MTGLNFHFACFNLFISENKNQTKLLHTPKKEVHVLRKHVDLKFTMNTRTLDFDAKISRL